MKPLRNEETEAGKKIWRMVDEAAERAPEWIRDHIDNLVTQRLEMLEQQEAANRDKDPKAK